MSIYGDLSKAQRKLLDDLFNQVKRAVSIDTALRVDAKSRQTAENLERRGFVAVEPGNWRPRVWLTPAGVELLRNRDFSHARGRRLGR